MQTPSNHWDNFGTILIVIIIIIIIILFLFFFIFFGIFRAISLRIQPLKPRKVSKSFINVSVYLVFKTNWGHPKKIKIIYK